jgi:uncharacterized protein YdhG (YjbR/CyaY superfamily)
MSAPTGAVRSRRYIAGQPAVARRALRAVRAAAKAIAPKAVDGFSYGVPCLWLDGRVLVYFAAFRRHYSLFPMTGAIRARFADAIGTRRTSAGTIQFPLDEPVPVTLVKRLVKARIAELRKRGK